VFVPQRQAVTQTINSVVKPPTVPTVEQSIQHKKIRIQKKLAATTHKTMLLSPSTPYTRKTVKHKRVRTKTRKSAARQFSLSFGAVAVLLLTGYVSVDTWMTNRKLEAGSTAVAGATDSKKEQKTTLPKDAQPDQTPLPINTLANYSVAPDVPRAVYVDKIQVAARTLPMSVDSDGTLQAPYSAFDAGWYTDSVKPGETGAMVFDGHSSGDTRIGTFGKLDQLSNGDVIRIQTGDMKEYKYKVVKKETVSRDKVDMQKVVLPYGNAIEGANFITCSGAWLEDDNTLSERTIVYTVRV
jgi:sortase (surface protein transpeptidase)